MFAYARRIVVSHLFGRSLHMSACVILMFSSVDWPAAVLVDVFAV